ncbi:HAMP domain-containing sensor histidine kinase [Seonamhaeicola sp.]|uniref:sensor histidine kinase n=1 Tax=Seonamhaeicola sp. TaxID=1912245 RepID=UPI0026226E1F|nr:HAMP domain-containing sensor histidine kinase [Seonamhaeicola sp.]
MTGKKAYWIIGIMSVLLVGLLINQIIYVYDAAIAQESHFKSKAQMALGAIVNEVSSDYEVCNSVKSCLDPNVDYSCIINGNSQFSRDFKSQKEWHSVDSIIQSELQVAGIDLGYNFDFCTPVVNDGGQISKSTFSKALNGELTKSTIVMRLDFPSRSNYILKQISPAFMSSILIILLLSIVFAVLFGYYRKERSNAERTRDFLNNMTHEFKTPMANIAFANNFLRRQSDNITPDSIKKYTAIIDYENQKIIDSSEDILELAKHEYDFSKLELETVDLHAMIYELQQSFMASPLKPGLEISLALDAEHYTLPGKTSFLQNALSNIIDNAIKYCRETPRILISTVNQNGHLIISVRDNGIGIPKNELNAVFEKFYRISTGDLHDVKGFGLGLSYVKMVVEQMRGTISIESTLDQGSVVTIKLPLAHD